MNRLKPYQFLGEEALTIDQLELVYWDRQKYIRMDEKENEHSDESMFMVQMVPNNGTYMSHVTNVPIKIELDEKHSMTSGSTRITFQIPKP